MRLSLRLLFLPAALAGLIGLSTAGAQAPAGGFPIKDEGGFFSREARQKGDAVIASIKRESGKDVLIETYPSIPEGLRERYKKEGKERFFSGWVTQRAEKEKVHGVAILICKDPEYLRVVEDRKTELRDFTGADRNELVKILTGHFGKGEFDAGLRAGLDFIKGKLVATAGGGSGKATTSAPGPVGGKSTQKEAGLMGNGILGWVCLGVGVLLALWLVVGLFRAFTGAGRPVERPPGNYVGGYGQGGYGPAPAGGGGGGFMSSMLGGMLGAGAGMWAYDTFFRGGSSGPSMTPPAYGGGTPVGGTDPQAGGTSGGSWGASSPADSGGGGDWGGGGSGGDTGGGGDWGGGGGGDTGGGGDWGGDAGGGDAGGGGDWGGGGDAGGDAGGDWGGGGGGDGGGGDW